MRLSCTDHPRACGEIVGARAYQPGVSTQVRGPLSLPGDGGPLDEEDMSPLCTDVKDYGLHLSKLRIPGPASPPG